MLIGRLLRGELVYETVNACIRPLSTVHACHVVTVEHLARPDYSHNDRHNERQGPVNQPAVSSVQASISDQAVNNASATNRSATHTPTRELNKSGQAQLGGQLHPVQNAMAECNGSQCGFCTPGIVMSLYALQLENTHPEVADIERALQGNLCRCTGYQPIIEAALKATSASHKSTQPDKLFSSYKKVQQRLQAIHTEKMQSFHYLDHCTYRPANTEQLAELLASVDDTTLIAGSTDVGLWINKEFREVSPLVSIAHIESLHQITQDEHGLTLGACVTYSEAAPVLLLTYPELTDYWYRIGGEQIRNMGTVGGNIANGSPIGDTPPVLIALGASVRLSSSQGSRDLLLEDYFIDYGIQDLHDSEFIESVFIPAPVTDKDRQTHLAAYKISKRFDEDISTLCCALSLTLSGGRVIAAVFAYGGMAATPKRAAAAELAVIGEYWTEETLENACMEIANDFSPLSDWRASAGYRQLVASNLLRRFYLETAGGDGMQTQLDRSAVAP